MDEYHRVSKVTCRKLQWQDQLLFPGSPGHKLKQKDSHFSIADMFRHYQGLPIIHALFQQELNSVQQDLVSSIKHSPLLYFHRLSLSMYDHNQLYGKYMV